MNDALLTAYHEAGHAVAALALGLGVGAVRVHKGGGGCCEAPTRPLPPGRAFDVVTMLLAGGAAEGRAGGPGQPSEGDWELVWHWQRRGGLTVAEVDKAWDAARRLVAWHWPKVGRVAGALAVEKTLGWWRVEGLMYARK